MAKLELKIPPPVVALLCVALMFGLVHCAPNWQWGNPWRVPLTALLVGMGLASDIAGLLAFRRHRTTVNPLSPHKSTAIVQDGIYRFTRNPMYLGMALLLSACAMWLSHPLAWLVLPGFVAYITRFQIMPEERILRGKFGEAYQRYTQTVRRWL